MFAWVRQLGIDCDGPTQVVFGLLKIAEVAIDDAAVVIRHSVVRRQSERLVRVLKSLIQLTKLEPGEPAVAEQQRRVRRLKIIGPRQIFDGAVKVALSKRNVPLRYQGSATATSGATSSGRQTNIASIEASASGRRPWEVSTTARL